MAYVIRKKGSRVRIPHSHATVLRTYFCVRLVGSLNLPQFTSDELRYFVVQYRSPCVFLYLGGLFCYALAMAVSQITERNF